MATLKTDYSDGQFLVAGGVESTSSVNGITATINSNTVNKLIYVGSDTLGSVASSGAETTIATVTIPPNTVATGIVVMAAVSVTGATNTSTFKIKIGATSSEADKVSVFLGAATSDSHPDIGGSLCFYDSTQTWSAEVTVLVTGDNSETDAADISTCQQLIVLGY